MIRKEQYKEILNQVNQAGQYIVVIGNYNAIPSFNKKEIGIEKSQLSIDVYIEFINKGNLVDLGLL